MPTGIAIEGLYSNWITDSIMAMQRPSTQLVKRHKLDIRFNEVGIMSIFNLQLPGEHSLCGDGIRSDSLFSYSSEDFKSKGIECFNFGWTDMTVPPMNLMFDLVHNISTQLKIGRIAIHCHAGLGRTGLAIACYLVFSGFFEPKDAIDLIRKRRPGSLQTQTQIQYVFHFNSILKESKAIFHMIPLNIPESIQNSLPQSPIDDISASTINLEKYHLINNSNSFPTLIPPPLRIWSLDNYIDNQQLYLYGKELNEYNNKLKFLIILTKRIYALGSMNSTNKLLVTMAFESEEIKEDYDLNVSLPNNDLNNQKKLKSKYLKLSQIDVLDNKFNCYYRNDPDFLILMNNINNGNYLYINKITKISLLVSLLFYFISSLKYPLFNEKNLKYVLKSLKHEKRINYKSRKSRNQIKLNNNDNLKNRSKSAPNSPKFKSHFINDGNMNEKKIPTVNECVNKMINKLDDKSINLILIIFSSFYNIQQITPKIIYNLSKRLSIDRFSIDNSINGHNNNNNNNLNKDYKSLILDTTTRLLNNWKQYMYSSWGLNDYMLAGFSTDHSQFLNLDNNLNDGNDTKQNILNLNNKTPADYLLNSLDIINKEMVIEEENIKLPDLNNGNVLLSTKKTIKLHSNTSNLIYMTSPLSSPINENYDNNKIIIKNKDKLLKNEFILNKHKRSISTTGINDTINNINSNNEDNENHNIPSDYLINGVDNQIKNENELNTDDNLFINLNKLLLPSWNYIVDEIKNNFNSMLKLENEFNEENLINNHNHNHNDTNDNSNDINDDTFIGDYSTLILTKKEYNSVMNGIKFKNNHNKIEKNNVDNVNNPIDNSNNILPDDILNNSIKINNNRLLPIEVTSKVNNYNKNYKDKDKDNLVSIIKFVEENNYNVNINNDTDTIINKDNNDLDNNPDKDKNKSITISFATEIILRKLIKEYTY